jgi:hypothetical protein
LLDKKERFKSSKILISENHKGNIPVNYFRKLGYLADELTTDIEK